MAVLATSDGGASGTPLNDCYGSLTQTAGTVIKRLIPPVPGARSCVGNWSYTAAATAHSLVFLVPFAQVAANSTADSGQAVINLNQVPTAADGSIIAANDYIVTQYDDGEWSEHLISSVSGAAITVSANFSKDVPQGAAVYFMGAPADHTNRTFTCDASTTTSFPAGDFRVRAATSPLPNQPILAYSANATNAGTLKWLNFFYD